MTGPSRKARVIGEEQVVAEADRLVANTAVEAQDLIDRYGADPPALLSVVQPGVDLDRFAPFAGGVDLGRAARPAAARPAGGTGTSSPSSAGSSR